MTKLFLNVCLALVLCQTTAMATVSSYTGSSYTGSSSSFGRPFGLADLYRIPLSIDPTDAESTDVEPTMRSTAIYDISAHVVVMPDGVRLEAHSGLGDRADNPRFVRLRMRGSTPPALYELEFRRTLFHGVMALGLKPIMGDLFGRTALLAHTYMLHGLPQSNGCVVFRDYGAFLKAFREGHIRWLRVVPSVGDASLRGA